MSGMQKEITLLLRISALRSAPTDSPNSCTTVNYVDLLGKSFSPYGPLTSSSSIFYSKFHKFSEGDLGTMRPIFPDPETQKRLSPAPPRISKGRQPFGKAESAPFTRNGEASFQGLREKHPSTQHD
jgi:hypothetical protein